MSGVYIVWVLGINVAGAQVAVLVQLGKEILLVIPSQLYRRGICFCWQNSRFLAR